MSWTDEIKKRLEAATLNLDFPGGLTDPTAIFIASAPTDIKNLLEEREVLREALKFYAWNEYDAKVNSLQRLTLGHTAQKALAFNPNNKTEGKN